MHTKVVYRGYGLTYCIHIIYSMVSVQQMNLSCACAMAEYYQKQHHFLLGGPYHIYGTSSQCLIIYGRHPGHGGNIGGLWH